MTYISYYHQNTPGVGVLEDVAIQPLVGIDEINSSTDTDTLRNAKRGSDALPLSEVTLRPSSPAPKRILCVGLNYKAHIEETRRGDSDYPVLFPKFASNLIAADADIQLPPEATQPDYEGELAVIIGRAGRRISEADALDHILGYSVANDVTIRDYQYLTHQWVQGKAWDASTPLGPTIVPVEDVDLESSSIRTILNDTIVQESPLNLLIFSIPRLISTISTFTQLEPGDVILTGTPGGVGYRQSPQVFLQPGDRVIVEVDGVGRVDNRVAAESV